MSTLRICEWSSVRAEPGYWNYERRSAIARAASAWREAHRLNALPLEWGGPDGCTLSARQWVGVVEVEGGRVEVYPKTDKSLLRQSTLNANQAQSTLHDLLRLLEASNYGEWVETDRAALAIAELTFLDLWAYLLARHLWPQLRRGLPAAYLPTEDDLTTVRGRIVVSRQLSRFQNRLDRVACAWDEFSPDTSLLRLFKCVCRFLVRRSSHPLATGLLGDCLFILDDVTDVTASQALRATERMTWTRNTERFRPTFDLARRILQGEGPQIKNGQDNSWVFLVDMNKVFESFVQVALEDKFQVVVRTQQTIGHLLRDPLRLLQLPDYLWNVDGHSWIGDAKWKLLVDKIEENSDENETVQAPSGKARFLPHDIRQMTTYAELASRSESHSSNGSRPKLAIFYPGVSAEAVMQRHHVWNGSELYLVPLRVAGWARPQDALPNDFGR